MYTMVPGSGCIWLLISVTSNFSVATLSKKEKGVAFVRNVLSQTQMIYNSNRLVMYKKPIGIQAIHTLLWMVTFVSQCILQQYVCTGYYSKNHPQATSQQCAIPTALTSFEKKAIWNSTSFSIRVSILDISMYIYMYVHTFTFYDQRYSEIVAY